MGYSDHVYRFNKLLEKSNVVNEWQNNSWSGFSQSIVICSCLNSTIFKITDLLATDLSRYFVQPYGRKTAHVCRTAFIIERKQIYLNWQYISLFTLRELSSEVLTIEDMQQLSALYERAKANIKLVWESYPALPNRIFKMVNITSQNSKRVKRLAPMQRPSCPPISPDKQKKKTNR